MKISIIAMVVSIIFSYEATAQSQNLSDYKFLLEEQQGYIITLKGDSLVGKLYMGSLPSYITFKSILRPDKEEKYFAADIVRAKCGEHLFKPMIYKVKGALSLGNVKVFLEVLEEGNKLGLYREYTLSYELNAQGVKSKSFDVGDLLIRPDGSAASLKDLKFMNFAKGMSKYIEDNAVLSQKVLAKEKGFMKMDLKNIIKEYNQ